MEMLLIKPEASGIPILNGNYIIAIIQGMHFDLVAWVIFTHAESGETIRTQMFYDGDNRWKFRFTGTRLGLWDFTTSSQYSDLDNHNGRVVIEPNPNPDAFGFIGSEGNIWIRNRGPLSEVFVPQLVMYVSGEGTKFLRLDNEQLITDIQEFIHDHGFNGFHVPVMLPDVWMTGSRGNPDPRISTFEKLELIITETHLAGGMVHLWIWGDEDRKYTPNRFYGGKNGIVDKRLQRYIAARLGPLPGWSAGYGFDNYEWNKKSDQKEWYTYMHRHMGWPHMLGARWQKNKLTQATEVLDYGSYEQHRPDYDLYVKAIEMRPDKPSFSEDRFRIRQGGKYEYKDYNEDMTRRGLWHSTMAGGVANIWGDLTDVGSHSDGSRPYLNKEQIKTYSVFFNDKKRFLKNMTRENSLSNDKNTKVLKIKNNNYIFYREDSDSLHMNLSRMISSQPAIAVDTKLAYEEISLGILTPDNHRWQAPYVSDWAIAVGQF
jgi:hypothetical protein